MNLFFFAYLCFTKDLNTDYIIHSDHDSLYTKNSQQVYQYATCNSSDSVHRTLTKVAIIPHPHSAELKPFYYNFKKLNTYRNYNQLSLIIYLQNSMISRHTLVSYLYHAIKYTSNPTKVMHQDKISFCS
jgi:hypothetical protein